MERVFKADFSRVRVHVGPEARAIGALAFTSGETIVVAPEHYAPETPRGQRLLGHELAHVVQQRSGKVRNPLGTGLAIVHDLQLEAEAERLAAQAVAMPPAPPSTPVPRASTAAGHGSSIQAYFTLSGNKIWKTRPYWLPWKGYPYALVGNSTLPAQEKRGGSVDGGEDEYLDQDDDKSANIVRAAATGAVLRVSDDYEMAIEDSNLRLRQPKTFFASDKVLNASTQALGTVKSKITLVKTGQSITIMGWTCTRILHEVSPLYDGKNPDSLPQNCNEMAEKVVKVWSDEGMASTPPAKLLNKLLGKDPYSGVTAKDVKRYLNLSDQVIKTQGVNIHAGPNVGEAFMISSVNDYTGLSYALQERKLTLERIEERTESENVELSDIDELLSALNKRTKWYDYKDKVERDLKWPYHFGGVVAKSGSDRITLENYARGDNRKSGGDPRWYFQMYGTKTGQSFHEFHKGPDYVNPLTMRYKKRGYA